LSGEVWSLSRQIAEINQKENKILEQNKFSEEKENLSNALYEALDAIHSQIPQEAKDVGMKTEVALKQYLPKLEYKASQIESYINSVDSALDLDDLEYIKKGIAAQEILK
jgi:hypothetical protein